jgi:hypothetical protein
MSRQENKKDLRMVVVFTCLILSYYVYKEMKASKAEKKIIDSIKIEIPSPPGYNTKTVYDTIPSKKNLNHR